MEHVNRSKQNLDMTTGNVIYNLLIFSIPLLFGNVLQQLYNFVDSYIVSKYVSEEAFGAVSSSASLIGFFVCFVVGTTGGGGIVIAQYFGAKDEKRIHDSTHTLILFSLLAGLVLTVISVPLAKPILILMKTPENILPESIQYFQLYFLGITFTCLYNAGTAVYRAMGDSLHPLYYLIFSTVTNISLDYLFVKEWNWGVKGAAIATLISQFLSCVLVMIRLIKEKGPHKFIFVDLRIHKEELRKIISVGLPNGVQNSIISLANIFVQTGINSFGDAGTKGWGAYCKIEGFATMPASSLSIGLSNFVGQNIGAKKYERAKKGGLIGVLFGSLLSEILGLLFFAFSKQLISIFELSDAAFEFAMMAAHFNCFFYCFLSASHNMAGVFRGAGISTFPMAVMLIGWCAVRISYLTIMLSLQALSSPYLVFILYPITWSISTLIFGIFYAKYDWPHYLERIEKRG